MGAETKKEISAHAAAVAAASGLPSTAAARPTPGATGRIGEVYGVRWPDGRRFDNRRKVTEYQARLLVEGGVCDEVRNPSGILRYLVMRRNAPVKKFVSLLAQADFTTTQTGNLHEHTASKRKGL